jgi:hypothetical protein
MIMNIVKRFTLVLCFCLQSAVALYAQSNNLSVYGNVGIGTLSPDSLANYRIIDARGTTGDFGGIFQSKGYNGNTKTWLYSAAGVGYLGTVSNHPFSILTNGTERITITNDGKVGMGTTSPNQKLEVAGNAAIAQYGYSPSDNAGASMLEIVGSDLSANSATLNLQHAYGGRKYPFGMAATTVSNFTAALTFFTSTYAGAVTTTERMRIDNTGNIGMGTTSPNQKLEVAGNAAIAQYGYAPSDNAGASMLEIIGSDLSANSATLNLQHAYAGRKYPFGMAATTVSNYNAALTFFTSTYTGSVTTTERMRIDNDGRVGIGTISPTEKLSVNGNIIAKKIKITQSGWSDYVFDDNYKLTTLSSLEAYIRKNKHLPEVPSAKEVEDNGINVGDTQALLLKKIEELTLYLIEQDKKINRVIDENEKLKKIIKKGK